MKEALAMLTPRGTTGYSEEFAATIEQADRVIREVVQDDHRLDILAEFVLGFKPEPFHVEMMEWQDSVQEGMLLAWRGAAKTTFCTITRCIAEIIWNPNIRILMVADALDQAKTMLRQIKSHFEHNEKLRRIFGDFHTGAEVWAENQIIVNRRTSHAGEPTVMCAGVGTALPSRHFDLIICDDLVTSDNSQTEVQRQKIHDYFYRTLFPTLESPDGRLYVIGTKWHEEDLYSWLQKEDYAHTTMVIGVLDDDERSRWEVKYPTARMLRIRKANLAAFELQYMCRSGIGLGGIFSPEHFRFYIDLPADDSVFLWQGVDLAIGQKESNDFFAHFTIAIHKQTMVPYVLAYRKLKIPFPRQVDFVKERYDEYPSTVRVCAERNAYQDALRQQVRDKYPDVPIIGVWTDKDKVTRAQKRALFFTDRPLHVNRGHHELIRILCGFPGIKGSKDLFDAMDFAVTQGLRGAKKKRRNEPGLI